MKRSISNIDKRSRGRPATDATPVLVRVPPIELRALDGFIADQREPISRPEAIRLALRDWLIGLGRMKP